MPAPSRLRRCPAPPFAPPEYPALQAWWRSDTGVYTDTSLTVPASLDGASVAGWKDLSAIGNHATQATLALQPVLKLGIFNGRPGLLFARSASQLLAANGVAAVESGTGLPCTVVTIFKLVTNAAGQTISGFGTSANGVAECDFSISPSLYTTRRRADDAVDKSAASISTDTTRPHIAVWGSDGSNTWGYVDGVRSTGPVAQTASAITLNRYTIGARGRSTTDNYFDGYQAEHAVYNVFLGAVSRGAWESYSTRQYGVSVTNGAT